VGAWVYTYKRVLRIAVLGIAALVLVFWDQPTGKVIVVLALCVLVVLAIIEFLGRPPSPEIEVPPREAAGPEEPGPDGPAPDGPAGGVDVSDAPADTSDAIAVDPQRSPLKSDA
jgi:hypothetical protein